MTKKHTLLSVALALAFACNAHAILMLDAEITSQTLPAGGGGFSALGSVASVVDVDLDLDIPLGPGPVGIIGGGSTITTSVGAITITGGIVTVKDDGVDDLVEFAVNVNNLGGFPGTTTDGQIVFSFMGDLVSSSAIDAAMISSISDETTTVTYIDYSNTQLSNYTGVVHGVTAVPEASSMACLSMVGLGFVAWRNRKRFLRK